jgi:tRNA splicing endonuclease
MTSRRISAAIAALAILASTAPAYEVWIGTHLMRSSDATNLSTWELTASQVDGFNVNRAPHDTDPASNNEYRTIFRQFTNSRNAITEFARSQATRDPAKTDELAFPSIAARLEEIFAFESSFGYDLTVYHVLRRAGHVPGNGISLRVDRHRNPVSARLARREWPSRRRS